VTETATLTLQQAADAALAALRARTEAGALDAAGLEALFELARDEVRLGRIDRAFTLFGFLTLARPADERFMRGLAEVHRAAGRHDAAALTFLFLSLLHPGEAQWELDIADCLLRLKKPDAATPVLQRMLARLDADPQGRDGPIAQRARALLDLLSRKGKTDAAGK